MKRTHLVDLAEGELTAGTQLSASSAKKSSSKTAPADADQKPISANKKSAAKGTRRKDLDEAFLRRLRY